MSKITTLASGQITAVDTLTVALIETDGRKRHAGSAVLAPGGEALAVAHALLIEPREG